jgi:acyl-CoA thioester hydrolase
MNDESRPGRSDYRHFLPIQTRWNDMDRYGHVNNMVFYGYFDTVVTDYIMREGGLVVESQCRYHRPIAFPSIVHAGLRIGRLGNSSVRYEVGIFADDDSEIAADGHFIHVFVDREHMRPVQIPAPMRAAMEKLLSA